MGASGSGWNLASAGGVLEYPTAVYWSMQTLTTVGYGDIFAVETFERWYATLGMVIGGAFYGYMIGTISSTIALRDQNAVAYNERMSHVRAWLDHHTELPQTLRYRIKRYFERHLSQKAVVEDTAIINDLSPALVQDVSFFLIHEHVRCSVLFHDIANSALAHLMPILEQRESDPGDHVVNYGDSGTEMYIIMEGEAHFEHGHQWTPNDPLESEEESKGGNKECKEHLRSGDSFGEEIILGLEEVYHYTIVATTGMQLFAISVSAFTQAFEHLPDVMHKMHANFVQNDCPDANAKKANNGRSSIKNGGVPSQFTEEVLDALQDIKNLSETTQSDVRELVVTIEPANHNDEYTSQSPFAETLSSPGGPPCGATSHTEDSKVLQVL